MYKRLDTEFRELEKKQYEYELRWQWELSIDEVVDDILLDEWIDCDIRDSEDIEVMLWNRERSQIDFIYNRCFSEDGLAPIQMVEEAVNLLGYIKNVYGWRAEEKAQRIYEVGRIWIYSDGHIENSAWFDLMYDLEEIDHIIFSEDIDFEEFPNDTLIDIFDNKAREAIWWVVDDANEALSGINESLGVLDQELDRIRADIAAWWAWVTEALDDVSASLFEIRLELEGLLPTINSELLDISDSIYVRLVGLDTKFLEIDPTRISILEADIDDVWGKWELGILPHQTSIWIEDHQYTCLPEGINNGLNQDALSNIFRDISVRNNYSLEDLDESEVPFSGSGSYEPEWSGASATPAPSGSYSWVNDDLWCEWFFCITVEFQSTNYGAKWENETSVESVLSTVAWHLEKPANASLTQRKMTTNNFEISSIITDLSWMLRGFGIEVQTKPVPILEDEEAESNEEDDTPYTTINLLHTYYHNLWLDYNRRNDLNTFTNVEYQTKILETSAGMPVSYPENRLNELVKFQTALAETNRVVSKWIDKKILIDDTNNFVEQFSELEKFVSSIEDFSKSVATLIDQMKKIPTRSS